MKRGPLVQVVTEGFARRTRAELLVLGALLVVGIALLDYVTGPELAFSIFYLIPVALVARFAGRSEGIAVAAMSAVAWFFADLFMTYSNAVIHFWNSAVRLGLFLIVASLISELVASRRRQRRLVQFLAHDLRGPLLNVLRGVDALEQSCGDALDGAPREMLNVVRGSGRRMLPLVHALLDLDRLEGGEFALELEDVDVEELLRPALDEVGLQLWQLGVTLAHEIAPDVPLVRADRQLTVRVLVNLLYDAIAGSSADSTIAVRISASGAGLVTFAIDRHLAGIADGERTAADLPATPGTGTTSAPPTGDAGIGLEFCAQAVAAQGGTFYPPRVARTFRSVMFVLPAAGAARA